MGPEYKLKCPIFTLNSLPNSGMVTAPKYHKKKNHPKTNQNWIGSRWHEVRGRK